VSDQTPLPAPTSSARVFASTVDVMIAGLVIYSLLVVLAVSIVGTDPKVKPTGGQQLLIDLILLGVGVGLFVVLERTGGSVGKRIARLRTVGLDDTYPAPLSQLFMKYLLIFVLLTALWLFGAVLILLGLMLPFWRPDRRNAFDLVARLRVVPREAVLARTAPAAPDQTDAP